MASSTVRGAYYYYGSGYNIKNIDPSLFTHLFYAFANISHASYSVVPAHNDDGRMAAFSPAVKSRCPSVKTLLSIGGVVSPFHTFAAMAAKRSRRHAFISSSVNLARSCGFDGLDLAWEFSETPQDMQNLAMLFTEWRLFLQDEAKTSGKPGPLLLTAVVYYSVTKDWPERQTYPAAVINTALDWVNLMSYDLHGSWKNFRAGAHTALYDPGCAC